VEWRTGELAARHGLSPDTLRYYDRLGLLGPGRRSSSGQRVFTSEHDDRLRFVMRAKALGLSLEEIKVLLEAWGHGDDEETRSRLRAIVARTIIDARRLAQESEALAVQLTRIYQQLGGDTPVPVGDPTGLPEVPLEPAAAEVHGELARIEGEARS
jgi:MerR family Zn(II)-responsive transcriptional regulator of zntA